MQPAAFDDLMQRAVAGNEFAWSVLYDRFAAKVLGYATAQGASDPEALVGDVFADVARNAVRFRGDEQSFRAWLFTIAHNRIIDDRRRRSRAPAAERREVGDVEREAMANLLTEEVTALLDRLSLDQRNVLLLRVVADLSVAETARILGKKEGAVKAAQRRGLARLKDRVDIFGVTR